MIGVLWLSFFLFLTLRNKELGVIVTALMSPALSCLRWGFLDVYTILCLFFILLYSSDIFKYLVKPFPFKSVLIFFLLSKLLSTIFVADRHPYILLMAIIEALSVLVFWIAAMRIRDTMSIRSSVFLACSFVVGYGLFTFITNINPYIDETIREGLNSVEGQDMIRFGRLRIQSIFAYVETLGGFCVMMIALACIIYCAPRLNIRSKRILLIILFLSITCFLTSSRSQIAGMAIVLLMIPIVVNAKIKFLVLPFVLLLVTYFGSGYIQDILGAFSDTSSVSGSDADMRQEQLTTSFLYMMSASNVFIGHGLGFCDTQVIGLDSGIVGAESLWFRIMIDQGILGVVSLAYIFLYSIVLSLNIYKPFVLIPLAYLAIRTLAVVPDMSSCYIMFILILAIRFMCVPDMKYKFKFLKYK